MHQIISRPVIAVTAVVVAFASGVSGQQRTARIARQAVSVNQNPAVVVQTNCANAPAMPDIVLAKLSVNGQRQINGTPGQTYEIEADLENRGQCETGSFRVQISVYKGNFSNSTIIMDKLVQSIQPTRDRNSVSFKVTVSYTVGPDYQSAYTFSAIADPEKKVNEFIENNNSIGMDEGLEGPVINVGSKMK
jgi:hypothetical protein